MSLKSMTGFARTEGALGSTSWHWEVRSVNGRGLDIRLRLPVGYEGLEPQVRERAGRVLTRGNISATLNVTRQEGGAQIRLNEAALQQVIAAAERVRAAVGGEPPRIEGLIAIKGVLEYSETSESEEEARGRSEAMLASFDVALERIVAARRAEGERLAGVLRRLFEGIEALILEIAQSPARRPEAVRERLAEQVARLMEASASFDRARLHQEAILLATRADIEEELQRMGAHLAAARELLDGSAPAGRRLDFLSQEFNREANTLCSKASDAEIGRLGLELKALIDQMREQVQNIE